MKQLNEKQMTGISFAVACQWQPNPNLEQLELAVLTLHQGELRTYDDVLCSEQLTVEKGVSIDRGPALIPSCSNFAQVFVQIDELPKTVTSIDVYVYAPSGNEDVLGQCISLKTAVSDMRNVYQTISENEANPARVPTMRVARIMRTVDGETEEWHIRTGFETFGQDFERVMQLFVQD